jgi:hypothetical protein
MSELESLASRANELSSKVDFWNSAVIWALFITFLAAGAILISQRLAIVRSRQLETVQGLIAKIKEDNATHRTDALDRANRQFAIDLATETGRVAGLQKDAAEANSAEQRLESANLILRGQVATLETEAADAKSRQVEAERQLVAIRKPREMPANILPALKAAPAGKALIEYQTGEQETFIFAMLFRETLLDAGWQVPLPQPLNSTENILAYTPDMLPAHLSGMIPMRSEIVLEMLSLDPLTKPAEALSNALRAAHIKNILEIKNDSLPQDTVLIIIGPKIL